VIDFIRDYLVRNLRTFFSEMCYKLANECGSSTVKQVFSLKIGLAPQMANCQQVADRGRFCHSDRAARDAENIGCTGVEESSMDQHTACSKVGS
jgi:hypothetical protein